MVFVRGAFFLCYNIRSRDSARTLAMHCSTCAIRSGESAHAQGEEGAASSRAGEIHRRRLSCRADWTAAKPCAPGSPPAKASQECGLLAVQRAGEQGKVLRCRAKKKQIHDSAQNQILRLHCCDFHARDVGIRAYASPKLQLTFSIWFTWEDRLWHRRAEIRLPRIRLSTPPGARGWWRRWSARHGCDHVPAPLAVGAGQVQTWEGRRLRQDAGARKDGGWGAR